MNHHLATKKEYPQLVDIWSKSVQATHDFLKKADFEQIKAELPTYFPHLEVQVWTEDGRILGFSGVAENKLEMLFLDPAFIGKGYGKQILLKLLQEKNIQYVDVNEQNQTAKAFYKAMGFSMDHRSEQDDAGRPYPIVHLKRRDQYKRV